MGAYMIPRTVQQVNDNGGTPSQGDVDLFIYDNACNQIGDLPSAFSLSKYNTSLVAFDSELPLVVVVDKFAPPDGYGNNANIQFSYSTWTSPPLWNSGDSGYNDELNNSDDWFCWPTPSPTSTGATWLQVRISGGLPLSLPDPFRSWKTPANKANPLYSADVLSRATQPLESVGHIPLLLGLLVLGRKKGKSFVCNYLKIDYV